MNKKILVIGCSNSGNPHIQDTPITEKEVKNKPGWWGFVEYFKNCDVTVFAVYGGGYVAWWQLLYFLDNHNKLDYDEIFIQESWEPRIILLDEKILEFDIQIDFRFSQDQEYNSIYIELANTFNNINFIRVTKKSICNFNSAVPSNLDDKKINYFDIGKEGKCPILSNMFVKNAINGVEKICQQNNITGYVYSAFKNYYKGSYFKRLPITASYFILKDLNYVTYWPENGGVDNYTYNPTTKKYVIRGTGHPTEEGYRYLGNLIDKALIGDLEPISGIKHYEDDDPS